jgi:hypothetical protein
MNAHFPHPREFAEKSFIFLPASFQQAGSLGRVGDLTPVPQGDHGHRAIEGFNNPLVLESL